jgi:hypothetical protein
MTYATCDACGRLMSGTGCTSTRAHRWGDEPIWSAELRGVGPVTWPCHDCGTPPGGRHHDGCTVAECALGCRYPHDHAHADQAAFCRHRGAYSVAVH